MLNRVNRSTRTFPALIVGWCLLASPPLARAQNQDVLTRAKALYESAEYEQALHLLATLNNGAAGTEATAFQVFCLVALDRKDEARAAIERIVRQNPTFKPAEGQVSPRIRGFFDEMRAPLLPVVAREAYTSAKAAFDRKEWSSADEQFTRAMAVLDEISATDPSVSDLRTLANEFRTLTRAAAQLEAAAAAAAAKTTASDPPAGTDGTSRTNGTNGSNGANGANAPPSNGAKPNDASPTSPPARPEPLIYSESDAGVERPVPVNRTMPGWVPSMIERSMTFSGTLELTIDESGRVVSTRMVKPAHPRYDRQLVEAAKEWTFTPATRQGKPVRYLYLLAVNLGDR
jgi:TonB family protein